MRAALCLLVLFIATASARKDVSAALCDLPDAVPCQYAAKYSASDLLLNSTAQSEFLCYMAYWEGQFAQDMVGLNANSGLTYDGHTINQTTGEVYGDPHPFSAASKECIHVALLALALAGNPYACTFVSPNAPSAAQAAALKMLTLKIASYEKWYADYPGFGGYIPWFTTTDDGMELLQGWTNTVPALDNGELIWSIKALIYALQSVDSNLAARYEAYLNLLVSNAKLIFYDGNGHVRTVTRIANVSLPPSQNTYVDASAGSYLDDPYEGELFTWFLDFYGNWSNQTERDLLWVVKRPLLQAATLNTPAGDILVEKGWWYSAHEKWKYLMMPYTDVDINNRLFMNGERARTWYSLLTGTPGLHASVNDVGDGLTPPDYISDSGVAPLAFENVTRDDIITPYGTMALFVAAPIGYGLTWYHNMISGPRMQGPHGSTEAISVNGTEISPVLTWDSKVTTLLGAFGGVQSIIAKVLQAEGNYQRFVTVVQREWGMVFGNGSFPGENIPFALPGAKVPTGGSVYGDMFSTCTS